MKTEQTAIAIDADLCTVPWAAEELGLSERHVRRLLTDGKLRAVQPRRGSAEGKGATLLYAEQVREYKRARQVVTGA